MARQLAAVIDNGTGYTKMGYFLAAGQLTVLPGSQGTTRPPSSFLQLLLHANLQAVPQTGLLLHRSPRSWRPAPDHLPVGISLTNEAPMTWTFSLVTRLFRQMQARDMESITP